MKNVYLIVFVLFGFLMLSIKFFGRVHASESGFEWEGWVDPETRSEKQELSFDYEGLIERHLKSLESKGAISSSLEFFNKLRGLLESIAESDLGDSESYQSKFVGNVEKILQKFGEGEYKTISAADMLDFLLGERGFLGLGFKKGGVLLNEYALKKITKEKFDSVITSFLEKISLRDDIDAAEKIKILKGMVRRLDYFESRFSEFDEFKNLNSSYREIIKNYVEILIKNPEVVDEIILKDLLGFLGMKGKGFWDRVLRREVWKGEELRKILGELWSSEQGKNLSGSLAEAVGKELNNRWDFQQETGKGDLPKFKKYVGDYSKNIFNAYNRGLIPESLLKDFIKILRDKFGKLEDYSTIYLKLAEKMLPEGVRGRLDTFDLELRLKEEEPRQKEEELVREKLLKEIQEKRLEQKK